jgi:hypothetical protein
MPALFLTKTPKTYDGEYTTSSNIAGLTACRKLKLDPCMSPVLVSTQSEVSTSILVPKL